MNRSILLTRACLLICLLSLSRCRMIPLMFSDGSSGEYDLNDNIFTESEVLRTCKEACENNDENDDSLMQMLFTKSAFDKVIQLLSDRPEEMDDIGPEDLVQILIAEDFLGIPDSRKEAS